MTTAKIQQEFPHTCQGRGCMVCWWVDGRKAEQMARRAQLLARLDRIAAWQRHKQRARGVN